jgi:ribosomal protein S14
MFGPLLAAVSWTPRRPPARGRTRCSATTRPNGVPPSGNLMLPVLGPLLAAVSWTPRRPAARGRTRCSATTRPNGVPPSGNLMLPVLGPLLTAVSWTPRRPPARGRTRCSATTRRDGVQPSGYLIDLQHGTIDCAFQNLVANGCQQLSAGDLHRLRACIPGPARESLAPTPASPDGGRCHGSPLPWGPSSDTTCKTPTTQRRERCSPSNECRPLPPTLAPLSQPRAGNRVWS